MKESKGSKAKKIKIFIVDDHPMIRERLAEVINREPDLVVCGEAEDVPAAFKGIMSTKPDLAIVDLSLRNTHGIELIKDLKAHRAKLPILVLSMHEESVYAERALRAGALGYVSKQQPTKKVLQAVRQILEGRFFVSEATSEKFLKRYLTRNRLDGGIEQDWLSDRELEVYQMIGQGRTTGEIADSLHLNSKTVETYRERIKEKLNLRSGHDLVVHAIQSMIDAG